MMTGYLFSRTNLLLYLLVKRGKPRWRRRGAEAAEKNKKSAEMKDLEREGTKLIYFQRFSPRYQNFRFTPFSGRGDKSVPKGNSMRSCLRVPVCCL